ncbi:MAG: hypothetical protein IPP35_12590 [Elusimicrobia bacterium]|nr:hypothetical protein [Elusimicrobiota bacterium]
MIQLEFSSGVSKVGGSLYLADWVANAHKVPDSITNPYSLEQKIYKKAQAAGCGDLVVYGEKEKTFFPSRKLEEKGHDVLDEYDEETFWEGLVSRLAIRDIEEERGPDALEKCRRRNGSASSVKWKNATKPKVKPMALIGWRSSKNKRGKGNE